MHKNIHTQHTVLKVTLWKVMFRDDSCLQIIIHRKSELSVWRWTQEVQPNTAITVSVCVRVSEGEQQFVAVSSNWQDLAPPVSV